MALLIEDGTGVSGADSFITVAECAQLSVDYFGQALTQDTATQEAALRRAFVYMSALPWNADLWPTFDGLIPPQVKLAQTTFARVEARQVGALSPSVLPGQTKTLVGVGNLRWQSRAPEPGDLGPIEGSRPILTFAFDLLDPWLQYNPAKDTARGVTGLVV